MDIICKQTGHDGDLLKDLTTNNLKRVSWLTRKPDLSIDDIDRFANDMKPVKYLDVGIPGPVKMTIDTFLSTYNDNHLAEGIIKHHKELLVDLESMSKEFDDMEKTPISAYLMKVTREVVQQVLLFLQKLDTTLRIDMSATHKQLMVEREAIVKESAKAGEHNSKINRNLKIIELFEPLLLQLETKLK